MSNEYYRPQGFTYLPEVTKNLLIINGIFFLAQIVLENTFSIELSDYLGLHYFGSEKFRPFQFITYMFLHGNFQHILFNMFALWMFGYAIENYWGGKKFLAYYLICGVGAALTHYTIFWFQVQPSITAMNEYLLSPSEPHLQQLIYQFTEGNSSPQSIYEINTFISEYNQMFAESPQKALEFSKPFIEQLQVNFLNEPVVVGASGAVFGLLLAFGMLFPNSLIYIYFFIPMKAKYFVIIYGAIELFSGINNKGDNVAHFAHLGGMLFGLLLILYWKKKNPMNFY
ncbi:MAG: rhomboid family intramembrane serine protease [Bacteroidota bacterium]|jgi:membrane associated rhomboid family serine protease